MGLNVKQCSAGSAALTPGPGLQGQTYWLLEEYWRMESRKSFWMGSIGAKGPKRERERHKNKVPLVPPPGGILLKTIDKPHAQKSTWWAEVVTTGLQVRKTQWTG